VRAVFDPNVLVSALLAPTGAPAELILRWLAGDFELVVSEQLLVLLQQFAVEEKEAGDLLGHDAT